ncbi:MAG: hypothetical protein BWY09_02815 [Candidatus Hydrogenedentes bacterium ADurb.Bin179]|nr:MAG: hypothetical protein BWY09_02815 [Candidatus Hydrogenedentes bacterium ADurb.Bin179]
MLEIFAALEGVPEGGCFRALILRTLTRSLRREASCLPKCCYYIVDKPHTYLLWNTCF